MGCGRLDELVQGIMETNSVIADGLWWLPSQKLLGIHHCELRLRSVVLILTICEGAAATATQ